MKTISDQQAVRQFDEYSKLAHDGEKILVTREGKPWVLLTPPAGAGETKPPGNSNGRPLPRVSQSIIRRQLLDRLRLNFWLTIKKTAFEGLFR